MYIVTITQADGYVANHAVAARRLRGFLALASSVLLPGESLSYKLAPDNIAANNA